MPSDPSLKILLDATRQHENEDSWLDQIVEKELVAITATLPEWHTTSCLLHDLGNFLARTTTLLSRLSERVVNGQELVLYAESRIQEMEADTGFSELDSLNYMNEKLASLKSVASKLHGTVEEINAEWRGSRKPPFERKRERPSSGSSVDTIHDPSSTPNNSTVDYEWPAQQSPVLQVHRSSTASSGKSTTSQSTLPSSAADQKSNQDQVQELLISLSVRGTGPHVCPHGMACQKGGVRDGEVVVFVRNSAFKAHLQKHEKRFKCDMPGCTAKGGFARVDQLYRHQKTVPHHAPGFD